MITSFGTYHVCSRHHVTRQNSFDERLVLEDHHQALSAQTKLLTGQRNAVDVMSPPDGGINLSASTWRKETDGLMRKLSGWEKELVWGKAAVALGERSCVAVFPPYGDEDDDEEHDGGDDGGMDGGDEGGLDGGDDGGMDESSGLGPAQG